MKKVFLLVAGLSIGDHGDRFLNEFTEFIQKPVPMISYTNFSVTDYLSRIANCNYGFTQLAAHSSPYHHSFSNGSISAYTISNIDSYNYAYNLFCCSACNWTASGYLGGAYLFNEGNTLSVIGSTKTGGMRYTGNFYSQLPTNNIGKAFIKWWKNTYGYTYHSPNVISWSYGMTLLGDPLIDFRYEVCDKCVSNLVLTSFPDNNSSNMILYKAENSIRVSGNFVIPQGVHVIFDAPSVVFEENFSCSSGASFETRSEGCEL